MHESTVSRVTTNKYVHTQQGIFELKYFFNSSIQGDDGDLASEAVKSKIKQFLFKVPTLHKMNSFLLLAQMEGNTEGKQYLLLLDFLFFLSS